MLESLSDLPDDIASLRVIIAAQAAELKDRTLEVERLKIQLARLKRMAFGRSSEKIARDIEQLELALEDLEAEAADASPEEVVAKASVPETDGETTPAKAQRPRRVLPEDLPREEIRHQPDGSCAQCGGVMRQVGEDVTEILDYVPGHFRVIRHARPALSCRTCESMVQAPMPSLPVYRGLPSPGLLAQVLVSKYCDHLPLYRQSQIHAREGLTLERSLLAGWVGKSASLMAPLVEAIGHHVLAGDHIHADDTPIPVLAPGTGKTRQARQWVYLRDERPHGGPAPPAVLYRYTPDRKGKHPQGELKYFRGCLHADGYAGFNKLYEADGEDDAPVREHAGVPPPQRWFLPPWPVCSRTSRTFPQWPAFSTS
jgi:transposase